MEAILKIKALRKSFWISFFAILIALLVVRIFIIGATDDNSGQIPKTLASIVDNLFATLLTTGMVGAFIFYLTPDITNPEQIEILPPHQIPKAFEDALNKAESWSFNGGFGRYLRSAAIPRLSRAARQRHVQIDISGQIMDPRNKELCEQHAALRNSVDTVDGKTDWTIDTVRTELYSTILIALIESQKNVNLGVDIYLLNHFTPTRIDLSSDCVILTKEDRKAPAIRIKSGSYFFTSYKYELDTMRSQGFPVPHTRVSCTFTTLDEIKAEELLTSVQLWNDDIRPLLSAICKTVNKNHNPYG